MKPSNEGRGLRAAAHPAARDPRRHPARPRRAVPRRRWSSRASRRDGGRLPRRCARARPSSRSVLDGEEERFRATYAPGRPLPGGRAARGCGAGGGPRAEPRRSSSTTRTASRSTWRARILEERGHHGRPRRLRARRCASSSERARAGSKISGAIFAGGPAERPARPKDVADDRVRRLRRDGSSERGTRGRASIVGRARSSTARRGRATRSGRPRPDAVLRGVRRPGRATAASLDGGRRRASTCPTRRPGRATSSTRRVVAAGAASRAHEVRADVDEARARRDAPQPHGDPPPARGAPAGARRRRAPGGLARRARPPALRLHATPRR